MKIASNDGPAKMLELVSARAKSWVLNCAFVIFGPHVQASNISMVHSQSTRVFIIGPGFGNQLLGGVLRRWLKFRIGFASKKGAHLRYTYDLWNHMASLTLFWPRVKSIRKRWSMSVSSFTSPETKGNTWARKPDIRRRKHVPYRIKEGTYPGDTLT